MLQEQATQVKTTVAEVALGQRMAVLFYSDGSAEVAYWDECPRCGAQSDDGEVFTPDEAWGLLGAVRRFLPTEAYRRVAEAVQAAIEGRS